jgi:hypothetical protein
LRRYATVSAKPVSRLRARGKSPLGLENVCLWRNPHPPVDYTH